MLSKLPLSGSLDSADEGLLSANNDNAENGIMSSDAVGTKLRMMRKNGGSLDRFWITSLVTILNNL
jgi:hypothetical protein